MLVWFEKPAQSIRQISCSSACRWAFATIFSWSGQAVAVRGGPIGRAVPCQVKVPLRVSGVDLAQGDQGRMI